MGSAGWPMWSDPVDIAGVKYADRKVLEFK